MFNNICYENSVLFMYLFIDNYYSEEYNFMSMYSIYCFKSFIINCSMCVNYNLYNQYYNYNLYKKCNTQVNY